MLRSVLFTAHAPRGLPALTEEKVPAGGVSPGPEPPQQARVPSALTPHAAVALALTDAKVPVGGDASPRLYPSPSPQQARVPSLFTAQAAALPTLTERKLPDGGWPDLVRCSPNT
jgi:hypothetical protein